MRPIKFRAWVPESKTMLLPWDELSGSDDEGYSHLSQDFVGVERTHLGIDEAELMQFTGLVDCRGQEIYEGDICGYEDDPSRFVVIFEDGAFRKEYRRDHEADTKPIITQDDIDVLRTYVIGNVHQPPAESPAE
jgi:uncharacterized phage protein (TIGR01671 family)